ncbi:MAG: RNA polymerase factor sigma-32 [Rickettsiales bacterium]|nr:RNA polymerase factor sigma-32 [Rickettsiales bacterium]
MSIETYKNKAQNHQIIEKSLSIKNSPDNIRSENHSFLQYLNKIHKFPILTLEEEIEHSNRFKNFNDKESAKILIQSHLRLVVKIASKFRNYGLSMVDLVSEGNMGLMQALKKFEPSKGFRFSTYAMWWVRASIQEFILKSWSLVKIGTTVAQKKLFFNLNKIKKKLGETSNKAISPNNLKIISQNLNVSEKEVIEMDIRLNNSDSSLNQKFSEEEELEFGDTIASQEPNQEEVATYNQTKYRQENIFKKSLKVLNEREKEIIKNRHLIESPLTLEELSKLHQVSRERIRQIEESAINKIKKEVLRINRQKLFI